MVSSNGVGSQRVTSVRKHSAFYLVPLVEHKKNPMATVAAGDGLAVAVLNRNEPAFYCVPARAYEDLMDLLEDLELGRIADARLADGQEPVRVNLDEL